MRSTPRNKVRKRFDLLTVEELLMRLPEKVREFYVCGEWYPDKICRRMVQCQEVLIRTPDTPAFQGHWCCPQLHKKLMGDTVFYQKLADAGASDPSQTFDFAFCVKVIKRITYLRCHQ